MLRLETDVQGATRDNYKQGKMSCEDLEWFS